MKNICKNLKKEANKLQMGNFNKKSRNYFLKNKMEIQKLNIIIFEMKNAPNGLKSNWTTQNKG